MSTHAIPLTTEILDDFRAGLRRAGAPLADEFEPGLTEAEIDELGRQLGVRVPGELRTLWRWGTVRPRGVLSNFWSAAAGHELWPPAVAVSETLCSGSGKTCLKRRLRLPGQPALVG